MAFDAAARWRGKSPDRIRQEIEGVLDVRARELHEQGVRSEVEEDEFSRLLDERDAGTRLIEEHEAIARAFRRGGVSSVAAALGGKSAEVAPSDVRSMHGDALRSAALRALDSRGGSLSARSGDQVDSMVREVLGDTSGTLDGDYLARRILITESDAYRSAWQQVLTKRHPNLTGPEAEALRAYEGLESRAVSEFGADHGGYGIPVFIDPSIVLSSGAAAAPLLDIARVVPVSTNLWKGVTSAPPTWTFQTEGAAVTDAATTLSQPTISVHTARGFIPFSIEVGDDYPAFAEEMSKLLAAGYLDVVAQKTAVGSGTGEPMGIVTKLDATAGSEVLITTAGTIGAVDIFKAWNALPERFRGNASWFMSVSAESVIRSLATTSAGQATSYFTIDLNQQGLSRLNGRPVYLSDYFTSWTGTSGHATACVVGDFRNYVIARRVGMSVEAIPHLFQQVTAGSGPAVPTMQRGFLGWARLGADVDVTGAFRLLDQT
jgi:HK97 family phage major capsid protein